MTVRKREEKDNHSSNNEESKKEEDHINLQTAQSNSQNQNGKLPINEESERSTKRSRITESNVAGSTSTNTTISLGQDPLLVAMQILWKYYKFIDYLYQILKNDEEKQDLKGQWQKWIEILVGGRRLVMGLYQDLRTLILEMESVKHPEGLEKKEHELKKTQILSILNLFRHINSRIASSSNLRLVSDIKNRGKVMAMCLRELERSKQELIQLIGLMKVLREKGLR